ncbi:patatin-like phospholipase family protein [Tepidimonas charontis]|uniref:Patatin-like phospholipase n=1 Tax=Tepidimonas charontis TaxID=2267262 RepID=A0A554XBA5_9BURK|nr:patatin-like phospholipase family protein [Tepidimonas charontis]TSE33117.1 Patatin-like phospholipase [Tepidimonas charontis]
MALETLLASPFAPPPPQRPQRRALVLMGGGARTAYQVGVLRGLGRLLGEAAFPFHLILGTSAGALNGTYLASVAHHGTRAFEHLGAFWSQLRSHQVYQLNALRLGRPNLLTAGLTLMRQVRRHRALLDTLPLVQTLHRHLDLPAVSRALEDGTLDALAVTASSYTSGEHWTFFQSADPTCTPWRRPGRRAEAQLIGVEHLMASAAIPFLFPAVPLWVDGHKEYFGDGSMRQLSPLSGAIHLGARQILVIGVGQPQRAGLTRTAAHSDEPSAGTIAGHALASVFHDTLQADVEQAQRVSRTLAQLPPAVAALLPYRPVDVLCLQPSVSLDELALKHVHELPAATRDTLAGLGALETRRSAAGSTAALASYVLFEPGFVHALMQLGEADAHHHAHALRAFFAASTDRTVP